ncbi:MAG: hypothetical protein U0T36_01475 [Saprospiraceae bacterium]|jgi:heme/copper-type cytochrome/quinol oxidase subunit 4
MKNFIIGYIISILVLIPILWSLMVFVLDSGTNTIIQYSLIMFTGLSIGLYYFLSISVRSPNKQMFISVTIANTLIKIVCSIGLLFAYKKVNNPPDGNFIFPFLAIYLVFTIFETWFMVKMADEKPVNK